MSDDGLPRRFHRRVQPAGGSSGCVVVNLTEFGRRYHDLEPQDDMIVEVREDEIAVREHPANGGPDR